MASESRLCAGESGDGGAQAEGRPVHHDAPAPSRARAAGSPAVCGSGSRFTAAAFPVATAAPCSLPTSLLPVDALQPRQLEPGSRSSLVQCCAGAATLTLTVAISSSNAPRQPRQALFEAAHAWVRGDGPGGFQDFRVPVVCGSGRRPEWHQARRAAQQRFAACWTGGTHGGTSYHDMPSAWAAFAASTDLSAAYPAPARSAATARAQPVLPPAHAGAGVAATATVARGSMASSSTAAAPSGAEGGGRRRETAQHSSSRNVYRNPLMFILYSSLAHKWGHANEHVGFRAIADYRNIVRTVLGVDLPPPPLLATYKRRRPRTHGAVASGAKWSWRRLQLTWLQPMHTPNPCLPHTAQQPAVA